MLIYTILRSWNILQVHDNPVRPIDYLFTFHSLREVRTRALLKFPSNTQLLSNLRFLHTIKVLYMSYIPSSFLAGQTFHQLERFKEGNNGTRHNQGHGQLTEMPICTRVDVSLSRLATLKLPQICELSVCIDVVEPNNIWEKHIAVTANLPGLKLLYLWNHYDPGLPTIDIIKILRSLSSLETLVIDAGHISVPYAHFFRAFVPMDAQGISEFNQSSPEGQILGVLCPRLQNLQINDISLTEQPELMPVLKEIVILRAILGSPLNRLTFYHRTSEKKWELIGEDRRFIMKEVVSAQFISLASLLRHQFLSSDWHEGDRGKHIFGME
jgi:hypothetical protein